MRPQVELKHNISRAKCPEGGRERPTGPIACGSAQGRSIRTIRRRLIRSPGLRQFSRGRAGGPRELAAAVRERGPVDFIAGACQVDRALTRVIMQDEEATWR
jgi:hypothetical protein